MKIFYQLKLFVFFFIFNEKRIFIRDFNSKLVLFVPKLYLFSVIKCKHIIDNFKSISANRLLVVL